MPIPGRLRHEAELPAVGEVETCGAVRLILAARVRPIRHRADAPAPAYIRILPRIPPDLFIQHHVLAPVLRSQEPVPGLLDDAVRLLVLLAEAAPLPASGQLSDRLGVEVFENHDTSALELTDEVGERIAFQKGFAHPSIVTPRRRVLPIDVQESTARKNDVELTRAETIRKLQLSPIRLFREQLETSFAETE
jgi:hypothetical protein